MKLEVKRALLSVSDKSGIVELAKFLHEQGVELISTGGTRKKLEENGLPITPIEEVTKNPEAFGGRMKTISFQIGSSLLFRREHPEDIEQANKLGIRPIDLVVCNLYPFKKYKESGESNIETLIENIDIGGPTMIRAAAKNYKYVQTLTNPSLYDEFMNNYQDGISLEFRTRAALEAFRMTASYDHMIASYLPSKVYESGGLPIPDFSFSDSQAIPLRYGENSHQKANLFLTGKKGIAAAKQLQGKAISYNNLLDAESAWKSAGDANQVFDDDYCTVSVIKHLNPCGLASAKDSLMALKQAWAGDPVSAFGGIICSTKEIDENFMEFFKDKFIEVLIAPKFTNGALEIAKKKKNLRVLVHENYIASNEVTFRTISGGVLVQEEDEGLDQEFTMVTENQSIEEDKKLYQFGIMACKHLKSNGIALVLEKDECYQLVGAGMGQPNRIDSLKKLSIPRCGEKGIDIKNTILISDAFFPFADTVEECASVGITKIVQPGGSIRDNEVIEAANKASISMCFTGRRHFRH